MRRRRALGGPMFECVRSKLAIAALLVCALAPAPSGLAALARFGDALLAAQEDYVESGAFPELLSIYPSSATPRSPFGEDVAESRQSVVKAPLVPARKPRVLPNNAFVFNSLGAKREGTALA